MTGSINIRLQSADTVMWATTDTTGHAYFHDIPYDTYQVWIGIFSCELYDELITITSDTAFDAILGGGTAYPPRGLAVDCHTLLASWNAPMAQEILFSETWASGNFTANNWTSSGGVNWMISTNFGNPAPSAAFNWTPQVTNYDQYLTSKTITGVNAPQTKLSYDIFLSSFATTYLNAMAVELWDGTSWDILKVYDNMNGNIPWTSETLLLPVTGNDNFKIRFHAYGTDSYDLNNWNIDNIRIVASENIYPWGYDPYCMIGYNFYLNSVLAAFTTDTVYNIPPDQVQYGQTYTACVTAVYDYNVPSFSAPVCKTFTSCFLYAPTNFEVQPLECSAWLTWEKPQELGGGDPPGLIGYYIYREYVLHDSVMSPDVLEYYDLGLDPGKYHYAVAAVYDISTYGFPGQRDESLPLEHPAVNIVCGDNLPFLENWNNGTFTYSDWTFEPSQGNWDITTSNGNPAPTADFAWLGEKSGGPYEYSLISPPMDASQWTCSNVWLDFDIKLINQNASSTEFMTVEVWYNNEWHEVAEYVNSSSFGYITAHININAVRGKGLKVRFRAHGEDPYNILHWYIDNINVYGVCLPATGLAWSATTDQVDLSWEAPCPEVNGYNVYRTDSSGNIPYYKLNTDLVTGTAFTDLPSYWTPEAVYRYYVTAVTMDEYTTGVLCESGASDTVLAAYPLAVPGLDPSAVEVFPNPARQMITVKSEIPILEIGMISYLGRPLFSLECGQSLVERIRISGFANGVYFLKIRTEKGMIVKKVIVEK
jgi:hypothetical protein